MGTEATAGWGEWGENSGMLGDGIVCDDRTNRRTDLPLQPLGFEPPESTITTFGRLGFSSSVDLPDPGWVRTVALALFEGQCDVPALGDFAATCMDDRWRSDGSDPLLPNVAGGVFGLLFAARAVTPGYDRDLLTAENFMNLLRDNNLPLYAHIDEEYPARVNTGCAFNDQIVATAHNVPRILADTLAIFDAHPDDEHMSFLRDTAARLDEVTMVNPETGLDSFGEDSFSRLAALQAAGGITEFLGGPHLSPGVDISFRHGWTVSRDALRARYDAQIFHLDPWSYRSTAITLGRILPRSNAQIQAGITAESLTHQMATAMFLNSFAALSARCGSESLLVIRK